MKRIKSIRHKAIFYGFLLWVFVQVPISIISAKYFLNQDVKKIVEQRQNIESVLSTNFASQSRYGEYLQAAKTIDALAKTNGLNQVGLCVDGRDLRGFFNKKLCERNSKTTVVPVVAAGRQIELYFNWQDLPTMGSKEVLLTILRSIGLGFVVIFGLVSLLSYLVSKELLRVSTGISQVTSSEEIQKLESEISELQPLVQSFSGALKSLDDSNKKFYQLRLKHESESHRLELSRQVAHDIRSPLSALNILAVSCDQALPEKHKNLLKMSIARINSIAENLLVKNMGKSLDEKLELTIEPLGQIVEQIFSEKKLENLHNVGVEFELQVETTDFIFSEVNATELKRVLSNLINNAVEAVGSSGRVALKVSSFEGVNRLSVSDDGIGVPDELKEKIFAKGFSKGKAEGNGLGLYHAKETIRKFGGQLLLNSKKDEFTEFVIELPSVKAPEWCATKIVLNSPRSQIVVIDDDLSIHGLWDLKLNFDGVNRVTCYNKAEDVLLAAPFSDDYELFLVDHDLIGSSMNGLDLIAKLGIQRRAILVTSGYEDSKIRQRAKDLHLKVMPKTFIGKVPVERLFERPLSISHLQI